MSDSADFQFLDLQSVKATRLQTLDECVGRSLSVCLSVCLSVPCLTALISSSLTFSQSKLQDYRHWTSVLAVVCLSVSLSHIMTTLISSSLTFSQSKLQDYRHWTSVLAVVCLSVCLSVCPMSDNADLQFLDLQPVKATRLQTLDRCVGRNLSVCLSHV